MSLVRCGEKIQPNKRDTLIIFEPSFTRNFAIITVQRNVFMQFEDSKYDIDEETRNLPSTVNYFPTISDLEDQVTEESGEDLDDSVLRKISLLQIKLEQLQYSKDSNSFGRLNWNFNKFARHTLYELANEVFGFNGWSTSIEECIVLEMNGTSDQREISSGTDGSAGNTSTENMPTSTSASAVNTPGENSSTRYSAKCICVIRLTLNDGTWKEGIGEGSATNLPDKYMCYPSARKRPLLME